MVGSLEQTSYDSAPAPRRFGRFYLQEMISSGGMADIWLATDEQNKAFALRRMHERLRFSFAARRRFVHGCEILAAITGHPGIVGYVEHGKAEGRWYCLMDYLEAANLKDLYGRQDEVLAENVAQILIDMGEALEHMHEKGFMHLDFKPENVLVSRNASVRLIDFDLAQSIPEKPARTSKKNPGTPAYMAPEQLLGQPLSHHVDIFAFGVTAYELLTSHKPFPGDTPADILKRQLDRTDFVEPRQYNPDIPARLERVILRCLGALPQDRHPVISAMVRDLKDALYVGG